MSSRLSGSNSSSAKRSRYSSGSRGKRKRTGKQVTTYKAIPKTLSANGRTFPLVAKAKLVYCDTLNLGVGPQTWWKWRANSVYDPDYSVTGHQPLYFDQFMAIYDHFYVVSSKCTIELCDSTVSTAPWNMQCTLYTDDDTTGDNAASSAAERPGAATAMYSTNTSEPVVLTQTYSYQKFFGGGDVTADSLQQGTVATNPTESVIFQMDVLEPTLTRASALGSVRVKLEYWVIFTELATITQS